MNFGFHATSHISPQLLAALLPVFVIIAAFDVYCLVDLARGRPVRYLPKIVWALVVLLGSPPVGGVVYLFAGRGHDADGAER